MTKLSPVQNLPSRVKRFIKKSGLARQGEKWLVGVSGGPDSVCLLHLLSQIGEELGITLHAVHLNHGLRGKEAQADARYVAELAARLGVPLSVEKRDVLSFKKKHHSSVEEAAREVRYLFFHEQAMALNADKVALAHSGDDQAETVLLHLIWGTGSRGLKGMAPVESWHSPVTGAGITVVRPLLEVTRAETEAYCQYYDLKPRYDASNRSPLFLRNRIRSELLPLLESFNSRIQEALRRTSELITLEQEALEALASPLIDKLIRREGEKVTVDVKGMLAQPPGLQRFLLRSAWALLKRDLRDLEAQHIEKMRLLLAGKVGKRIHLPSDAVFHRDYEFAVLSPEQEPFPVSAVSVELKVPGEADAMGYRFRASLRSAHVTSLTESDRYRVCMGAEVAGRVLTIRPRRPGDRFQPLGMDTEKKLQDFMVDAKIPQRLRSSVPIVCSAEHILWLVGWRLDDRAKVTDRTRKVLVLEGLPHLGL